MNSFNSTPLHKERLASLDILRGFDLFMLVFFQPVFVAFAKHSSDVPLFSFLLNQFNHVSWEGFAAWDLVMPLFLFMVGAAMPFSFDKYIQSKDKSAIYKKIARRFVILFILGMVVNFRSIASSLLWGLEKYVGDYYGAILTFANFTILFLILNLMYRMRVFVKI